MQATADGFAACFRRARANGVPWPSQVAVCALAPRGASRLPAGETKQAIAFLFRCSDVLLNLAWPRALNLHLIFYLADCFVCARVRQWNFPWRPK